MSQTVGLGLRRTAGGGVIFALSFGALASPGHQLVPVAAVAAASSSIQAPAPAADHLLRLAPPPQVMTYEELRPTAPVPIANQAPVLTHRLSSSAVALPRSSMPVTHARPAGGSSSVFAYGYCTWWVAQKRSIPWHGNAAEWWWNARGFGFAEGQAAQHGAIMVMGISGSSPLGHVGYVESVNANGSFVVSEMNWWGVPGGGWGRVDYRTVTSMRGILGFIY